jgi:hypothetical protein
MTVSSEEIGMYADNWILAFDMLYHLRPSRHPLISYAWRDLRASLMAFDLLLSEDASLWERLMFRFVCTVTGTPFSNFLAEAEYKNLLVGAGYEHDCMQIAMSRTMSLRGWRVSSRARMRNCAGLG